MLIGKVIGRVVSTRKNENLVGNKFMIVEPLPEMGNPDNKLIAIDNIGAGIGETVLVALGSAAAAVRKRIILSESPITFAITQTRIGRTISLQNERKYIFLSRKSCFADLVAISEPTIIVVIGVQRFER